VKRNHGFSVAELAVTLAVFSVVSAVALPRVATVMRSQKINSVARHVLGDLRRARAVAASGRVIDEGPPIRRIKAAGIRIDTPTRYSVYMDLDRDPDNSNDVDIRTVDLADIDPEGTLQISEPTAGTKIRFGGDGGTDQTITFVIENVTEEREREILLTQGGQARLK